MAIAAAVTLSLASVAATAGVTEAIDLDSDSRFEVAVAGQIQLPAGAQNDSDSTATSPEPVGPTIDPNVTTTISAPTTQATQPPASSVRIVVNNTNAGARGQAALDKISYPWEETLDGWTISFNGPRSDISGWIDFGKRTIYLYVRTSHSDTQLAHVMAHEIGHAVDFLKVSPSEKSLWLEQRGISPQSWYPSAGGNDFNSPAGDFAEAFAVWQVGGAYQATIASSPTQADFDLLAEITR